MFGQICANIMEYCQTLLLQSSAEAQFTVCLFSPSASEPTGQLSVPTIIHPCVCFWHLPLNLDPFCCLDVAVPSVSRVPSLGLVLLLLKNSTTDFFRYHDSHRQSLSKLERLEQLAPEELKEVDYKQTSCFSVKSDGAINNSI